MPSLKTYNTFGFNVHCSKLVRVKSVAQLQEIIVTTNEQFFILGGGSNILLENDLEQTVLKNDIKERSIIKEIKSDVFVRSGGGENWHRFVRWTIKEGIAGLENLSLIPGSVGAAPMQNIGAYGVEIKDVFHSLQAVNMKTGKLRTFNLKQCNFGYRSSVFKEKLKDNYFITSVVFKLSREKKLNLGYGAIKDRLDALNLTDPTIRDVSNVIIEIRNSKLPDPKKIGNSGSFFKNPVVSTRKANLLKKEFRKIPLYPQGKGKTKISAGWLIEQCGWKGKSLRGAACYDKHALILINKKNAAPNDVIELSQKIQASVKVKFGIDLIPEVNFIK